MIRKYALLHNLTIVRHDEETTHRVTEHVAAHREVVQLPKFTSAWNIIGKPRDALKDLAAKREGFVLIL